MERSKPKKTSEISVKRNEQMIRVFTLMNLLESHSRGLTIQRALDLLREKGFEVGKRTVYRDFEGIRALGFSLREEPDGTGDNAATVWSLDRTARFSEHLAVDQRELIALYLARQTLQPLRGTPFFRDLDNLFTKIDAKIGKEGREFLGELSKEIQFHPGPIWGLGISAEALDSVHWAITQGHQIACTYLSASGGTKNRRILGPHILYFASGALYLLAEDIGSGKVKVFSLSRMSEVEKLEAEYSGSRVDPEEYFANSIGVFKSEAPPERVRILFSGAQTSWIRDRNWHSSQRIVSRPEGEFELHLEVQVTPDLVNMILGFGPGAEVLEPRSLADQVKDAAGQIASSAWAKKRKAG